MKLFDKIRAAFSGTRSTAVSLDTSDIVATDENVERIITDKIMECVELMGAFPKANIDPRAFDHLRVYDSGAHKYGLKKPPFEWMKDWLDAYDRDHSTERSKEILSWINQQPMGC